MIDRLAFNLAFNAVLSFGLGLGIVLLALMLLRPKNEGLRLYLLSLPFVKILYDLGRWIPAESYVWTGHSLLDRPLHGDVSLGLGLNEFGPYLWGGLRVLGDGGARFTASLADLVAALVQKYFPSGSFSVIILAIGTISTWMVARRSYGLIAFAASRYRRRQALPQTSIFSAQKVGRRTADVYVDSSEKGSPYTGGIWHPYVCFPVDAYQTLSPAQRDAVLLHELAHIRRFDVIQAVAISLLGDVFWFVPGYRWLRTRLDQVRELVADRIAVSHGADPVQLAGALIAFKSHQLIATQSRAVSALVKPGSTLAQRIARLLEAPQKTPLSKRGLLLSVLVTGVVMMTSIGGNRGFHDGDGPLSRYLSEAFMSFLGLGE